MVDIDPSDNDQPTQTASAKPVNQPPQEAAASPLASLTKVLGGGAKSVTNPSAKKTPASSAAPEDDAPAAAGGAPVITGPLLSVVTRNEFYRDGFRNMIRIAILQAFVIVGLILTLIVYMNAAKPTSRYFATTADGRILQLVPLDQQNIAPSALMSWVAQAVTETMTFGFNDYQRKLQQSSRHFTRRGWETFTSALQKSHLIDSITAQQQMVSAEPRNAPILVQQGVFNGKYRWVVKLPIRVSFRSGTQTRNDSMTVTLVVERVPSLESPSGVGIDQWVAVSP